MSIIEYEPGTKFPGKISRTVDDTSPAWPVPKQAKEAPSI